MHDSKAVGRWSPVATGEIPLKRQNYIIIGVIAVIVVIAVISSVKHFKGEGGCCGGGSSYKPKKKKLASVRYQKVFLVDGMHCDHCKNRVEEIVNDIPGIAGKVDLKKGELVVSYMRPVLLRK